jgi:hypothetical protein
VTGWIVASGHGPSIAPDPCLRLTRPFASWRERPAFSTTPGGAIRNARRSAERRIRHVERRAFHMTGDRLETRPTERQPFSRGAQDPGTLDRRPARRLDPGTQRRRPLPGGVAAC